MAGRKSIADRLVAQALRLKGTCSQRAAAAQLGISRTSVQSIWLGRHLYHPPVKEEERVERVEKLICPGCRGEIVQLPCVACRARRHMLRDAPHNPPRDVATAHALDRRQQSAWPTR